MHSSLEETVWDLTQAIATQSKCKKAKVGCLIFNVDTQEVVGRGWNMNLDGNPCENELGQTMERVQHAEITAIHDLLLPIRNVLSGNR